MNIICRISDKKFLIRGFKLLGTSKVLKYIFCNIESFCIVALFVTLTLEIIQCWLDKCFWKVIFYYWTLIVQLSKCHYCRDTAIFWVPILKVKHWVPRLIADSLLSRMFENKKAFLSNIGTFMKKLWFFVLWPVRFPRAWTMAYVFLFMLEALWFGNVLVITILWRR